MGVVHFATIRLGKYLGPIAKESFGPPLVHEGSILSSNGKSTLTVLIQLC